MNELEDRAFKAVHAFYQKWREKVIQSEADWEDLARDVGVFIENGFQDCILARNLITAVLDTLNELYADGKTPMPANYFGRDDL